jgi:hypothetical protein
MDVAKRLQMIYGLQKMIYEQSPYIPLAYSDDTEAWNTSRWTGWVESPARVGNVVSPPYGYETFYEVRPIAGAGGAPAGQTGVLVVLGTAVVSGRRRFQLASVQAPAAKWCCRRRRVAGPCSGSVGGLTMDGVSSSRDRSRAPSSVGPRLPIRGPADGRGDPFGSATPAASGLGGRSCTYFTAGIIVNAQAGAGRPARAA